MKKSKTVMAAVAGLLTAAGSYLAGEMELQAALSIGITCVLSIFLRAGVQKAIPAADDKSA
tara:strand:- start:1784 stop:1966 length:183 start_codon:yes stop_codon:yes gene_type:complete